MLSQGRIQWAEGAEAFQNFKKTKKNFFKSVVFIDTLAKTNNIFQ